MMGAMLRRLDPAMAMDAACIGLFVVIGRSSHHEGNAVTETIGIAAPFLIALAVGWAVVIARKQPHGRSAAGGLVISLITVSLGLVLRRFVFDRGTALAFVIVATLFLGFLLNGWRTTLGRRWAAR